MTKYYFKIGGLLLLAYAISFGNLWAQNNPMSAKKRKGAHSFSVKDPLGGPVQVIRNPQLGPQGNVPLYRSMSLTKTTPTTPDVQKVVYDREEGLPIYIEATAPQLSFRQGANVSVESILAYQFLADHEDLFQVENTGQSFEVSRIDESEKSSKGMVHVRMTQSYQGIPVYGSEVVFHFYPGKKMVFGGRYQPQPQVADLVPDLDDQEAADKALAAVAEHGEVMELNANWKDILKYEKPETELVIYRVPGNVRRHRLAYHVTVRPNVLGRWEYWIDAQNGEVLNHYDHTCSFAPATGTAQDLNGVNRSLGLWNDGGTYYLLDASTPMYTGPTTGNALPPDGSGFILTADMNNTSISSPSFFYATSNNPNSWPAVAVSGHYNARESYEYFRTTFNRNSINGSGGDVVSFVNVADDNGGGLDNAFWNGQAMFYGNGAQAFFPLAGSKDVGGHEMSHGVIQETANLEYQGQSGALNESYADIFGAMIDRDDWRLGEDVVRTSSFPSGALRDMQNPNQGGTGLSSPGWQPANMSEIYTGNQDNGGVHINSGIVNRVYYLFATATSKSTAEQVYYRALTTYLTRSSQFLDARFAIIKAAEDLNGGPGNGVAIAAGQAFDQVGLTDPNGGTGSNGGTNYENDVPTNPGQQFIVSNDVNPGDNNTWYNSSTAGANFVAYSQTAPQTRISVRDDGRFGYFVGQDKHIYELALDPNFTGNRQTQISNTAEWDNVAISKDGVRLAAISTSIDTSIYVFDFSGAQVRSFQFKLYNPTTAQGGATTGGVLYADAISWDFSGEIIMYDAFNRIPNSQGQDLEYWDVGFLRAWNNATNNAGDGFINKLFTNLPEGVSVGNAEFSSNSPYVIGFDYFEQANNRMDVLAANIEAGNVGTVFANNQVLGYPNFSTDDTKMIFNAKSNGGEDVLAQIDMAQDKITGTGQAGILINFVRFGTWYAIGNRVITSVEDGLAAGKLLLYPNPASNRLNIAFGDIMGEVSIEVNNLLGQQIRKKEMWIREGEELRWDVSDWAAGTYSIKVVGEKSVRIGKFVKE